MSQPGAPHRRNWRLIRAWNTLATVACVASLGIALLSACGCGSGDGIQLVDDVAKKAGPLLTKAYAFSQVAGKLMASENDAGPPASYYIADPDPGSPHPTGTKAPDPGSSYTNVAGTTIDQAAGFPLAGTDIGVYMGPGMSSLAVAVSSHANGSPITSGNPTILCGAGQLPLAGVGQSTATGEPVIDGYPEGVQMAMPRSWSPDGKHAIYTAQGTGPTPWDNNFGNLAAECGSDARVAPYYTWLAIDYPAQTFPMGPGIDAGVKDLVNQISNREGKFALVGYSQGAIITCRVWRDEILNPNGQLHDRLGDIFAHVTFGNPMRCPGIAHGNALVPYDLPMPLDGYVTGGIAGPDDLTPWQTAPWHMDFAHDGDMYAAAPVGDRARAAQAAEAVAGEVPPSPSPSSSAYSSSSSAAANEWDAALADLAETTRRSARARDAAVAALL